MTLTLNWRPNSHTAEVHETQKPWSSLVHVYVIKDLMDIQLAASAVCQFPLLHFWQLIIHHVCSSSRLDHVRQIWDQRASFPDRQFVIDTNELFCFSCVICFMEMTVTQKPFVNCCVTFTNQGRKMDWCRNASISFNWVSNQCGSTLMYCASLWIETRVTFMPNVAFGSS